MYKIIKRKLELPQLKQIVDKEDVLKLGKLAQLCNNTQLTRVGADYFVSGREEKVNEIFGRLDAGETRLLKIHRPKESESEGFVYNCGSNF